MKKTYIQPQMSIHELQLEGLIAASLKISDKTVDTSAQGVQLGNKQDSPWNSTNWE